jgi:uncharacterized protein (TIGR04255 family)
MIVKYVNYGGVYMPFPQCERFFYEKSPLKEVVCQLRFPRILSINAQEPFVFQERIRDKFPIYEEMIEQQQQISIDSNNPSPMPKIIHSESMKNYKFSTPDNSTHINLTSTFISISTTNYTQWEDFLENFREPIQALNDVYKPAFFDRVGLRYVDIICREALNLNGVPWSELIKPFALGFLSENQVSTNIQVSTSSTELLLDDDKSIARINTGLGKLLESPEQCFIVDSDLFYAGKYDGDVSEKLNYLHIRASRLLKWIITDKLHVAMEPRKL